MFGSAAGRVDNANVVIVEWVKTGLPAVKGELRLEGAPAIRRCAALAPLNDDLGVAWLVAAVNAAVGLPVLAAAAASGNSVDGGSGSRGHTQSMPYRKRNVNP